MNHLDQLLTNIATEHLGIATLKPQMSDGLDFHNVAAWQVAAALKTAFHAGTRSAGVNAKRLGTPGNEFVPAVLTTPLLVPKGTALLPGKMYIRLYHGRTDPTQEMDDWGFDGPTFGPLSCVVHTYCSTFRIHAESGTQEAWFDKHDDMIVWNACFYGDTEIFIAEADDKAQPQ